MSDGRTYDDHRLPQLERVDDEDGRRGILRKRMFAALLALFLLAGVGVTSYLAGRASWREPTRLGRETLPDDRQPPATPTAALPQPASPSELAVPPPVARMLEARSRNAGVDAAQPVEEQSVITVIGERRLAPAREFRPPRRVIAARRALVQPQRVLYASSVVQLGEYSDRRLAQAAHARLVRAYPYLKTLPKTITSLRPRSGRARTFQLRLKAGSPDHARILCQNLLAIGRGCAVLPERA